jgi:very-short-patch-repair endonuclease
VIGAHHVSDATPRARRLRRDSTLAERKLWIEVRKLELNVRRQAPIGKYVADFACHSARLVVELDGPRHALDEAQLHDAVRTKWLESQGYKVLRFPNEAALTDPNAVAQTIGAEIRTRRALPLDGGGLGGGVVADLPVIRASAPNRTARVASVDTPPSPTLPPSRGKGE